MLVKSKPTRKQVIQQTNRNSKSTIADNINTEDIEIDYKLCNLNISENVEVDTDLLQSKSSAFGKDGVKGLEKEDLEHIYGLDYQNVRPQ